MPVTTTKNVLRDLKKGLLNYKPATPPPLFLSINLFIKNCKSKGITCMLYYISSSSHFQVLNPQCHLLLLL